MIVIAKRFKVILETDEPTGDGFNRDILLAITHNSHVAETLKKAYPVSDRIRIEEFDFDVLDWLKMEGTKL